MRAGVLSFATTTPAAGRARPSDPDAGAGRDRPERRVSAGADRCARALGLAALVAIVVATAGVVLDAASGPSILVPRSGIVFPRWDSGPLHGLLAPLVSAPGPLAIAFSITLGAMLLAYAVVVVASRRLPAVAIVAAVVVVHAIVLLGPPLQLNDVFNYLGYARLGALHGLDPYTHGIASESFDPVFRFASWDDLRSPYGPLFTALTYPLAFLPLPLAYWIVKVGAVLLSLGFLALVWRCARLLHRDPRPVLAFVALNPIYIVYAVGGFHNDFLMLVPSMAAVAFVLRRRDASAGAALVIAVAVKFTAIILGPFLLVALATRARCVRFVVGALIALVPLLALDLALFGTSTPNLSQQSTLLTDFAVPNLVGLIFGVGGSRLILHLATVAVILVAVYELTVRRRHWIAGAGWVTLALVLSLSWEVPWYVIWVLPLAALARRGRALRAACMLLTVFLLFSFVPVTSNYVAKHRVPLLDTPAGRASRSLQFHLAN